MSTNQRKQGNPQNKGVQSIKSYVKQKQGPIFQSNQTQPKVYSPLLPNTLKKEKQHPKYRINPRFEDWQSQQVKVIFQLYQKIGSQWKQYVNWLPERSTNSIKNRFYTAIRNTLKCLFRQHQEIPDKIPHQISSKDLLRLFQGKQQFQQFPGFGMMIMKKMDYTYQKDKAQKLLKQYETQLISIYIIIFKEQTPLQVQKIKTQMMNKQEKQKKLPTSPQPLMKENEQIDSQNVQFYQPQQFFFQPNTIYPYQPFFFYPQMFN